MSVCPNCLAPYEEGQRFCKQCGSPLLGPEDQPATCPQCGALVSASQESCPQCNALLIPEKEPSAAPPFEPSPSPQPDPPLGAESKELPKWATALIAGSTFLVGFVLAMLIFRSPSAPPPAKPKTPYSGGVSPMQTQPAPPASQTKTPSPATTALQTPTPPGRTAAVRTQVEEVLNKLREANLQKDLLLYMSCFSYAFPHLDQKRQEILKTWDDFDFRRMVFSVNRLEMLGSDDVKAQVSCNVVYLNRRNQNLETAAYNYQIWFGKELGKWKIKDLTVPES